MGDSRVGVYIDPHRVCAVELASGLGNPRIARSAELGIPTHSAADVGVLSDAVRQVIVTAGITAREVSVALPVLESIIRRFTMPLLPKKEWSDAVRFEAQKYLPFDVRGLEYDAEITPDGKRRQMDVLIVAAKRESVSGALEVMRRAGIECRLIEPVSLSLLRLSRLGLKKAKPEVTSLVDLDPQGNLTLVIARAGSLMMTRDSLVPQSLGSPGTLDPEALLSEMRLSFGYFSKHFGQVPVDRLLLCGAATSGMDSALSRGLGIPVEQIDLLKPLQGPQTASLGLMGAAGLALRSARSDRGKQFNLASASTAENAVVEPPLSRDAALRGVVMSAVCGLALAAGFTLFSYMPLRSQVQNEIQQLQVLKESQPALTTRVAPATAGEAEELAKNLSDQAALLSGLIEDRVPVTTKLGELVRVIPSGIWLTRLEYEDHRFRLDAGQAFLRLDGAVYVEDGKDQVVVINRFATGLKENDAFIRGFESMKIDGIRKATIKNIDVTSFTLKAESKHPGSP